jgi:hypothetical protein
VGTIVSGCFEKPAATNGEAGTTVAERSTAAVDAANTGGGKKPPAAEAEDEATADGATAVSDERDEGGEAPAADVRPAGKTTAPDLHSGHKLSGRYRLEECVTRLDGFSSWRAVDEKLRRAVGVHVLSAQHPRARRVLAAARSAALLGDPRFVQVLDAVEADGLVHVVHEWLPDSTPLTALLAAGPLPPHEAYQLVSHLAQAMTAAHREGLAHLRLTPGAVLRTGSGQYRIRGLAVSAALRGLNSDRPQRDDTEAVGALLYAALTQRWPYEEDAYGLAGVGALAKGTLVAPDQVRAGVHRGLSELAMRALVNDGATACREEQPCATPEELAKAVAALPRIQPPEPEFAAPPLYPSAPRSGLVTAPAAGGLVGAAPAGTPPALPGRTGKILKWGVSALLIAALGLGSWQVADTLMNADSRAETTVPNRHGNPDDENSPHMTPLKIVDAKDFDPMGNGSENPEQVPEAIDGDPHTFWYTRNYYGHSDFGNLKPGVGLILDLGKVQDVRKVHADFGGRTSAELLAADQSASGMPSTFDDFRKIASGTGESLTYQPPHPVRTRYVLVWLTDLPLATDGNYRGRISEIRVYG